MKTTGLGRKKRGDVWTHFRYHETQIKTKSFVLSGGKQCGHKIAINQKKHIKAHHEETGKLTKRRVKLYTSGCPCVLIKLG